jgi:hypothetical protein
LIAIIFIYRTIIMNKIKWFSIGAGAVVALIIGGAVFSATDVSADNGTVSDTVAAFVDGDVSGDRDFREGDGRGNGGNTNEFLAEELGITEDELSAAREAARDAVTDETTIEERQALLADELGISVEALASANETARDAAIAEALENGDITQEQIDLREAKEALDDVFDRRETAAEILGLTVEEIEAAREDGTTKEELLEDAGLTQEEFKEAQEEAKTEAIEEAVTNGDITEEQATIINDAPAGERGNGQGNGGHGNGGQGSGGRGNGGQGNGGRGNGGQGNGGQGNVVEPTNTTPAGYP